MIKDVIIHDKVGSLIGFWLVNLLIPGAPQTVAIKTPSGTWTLDKAGYYAQSLQAMQRGQCANTYAMEHPVSMNNGAAACDLAFDEMTPLLLGASYLSGLSVTAKHSLPHSDVSIMQPGNRWPRERSMGNGNPVVTTQREFVMALEAFVATWSGAGQSEKALLLIHHWLDSLACWSFEDMYLSATTLLQIIAATEKARQGINSLSYFDGVTAASARAGIVSLSQDFKNMRNNLIHHGRLLGGSFSGTTLQDCSVVAADVLNWFDAYMHSALGLGVVLHRRFASSHFVNLNSYSV
jgi:hypothetical protein